MPCEATSEAGAWVTHRMMMLLGTEVARLLWLFFETVFGDMTFLEASETLYNSSLFLSIRQFLLEISWSSFAFYRLLWLLSFLLRYRHDLFGLEPFTVALSRPIHDSFNLLILLLGFFSFLELHHLQLGIDPALHVRLTNVLQTLLTFDLVREKRSFPYLIWILFIWYFYNFNALQVLTRPLGTVYYPFC